MSCYTEKSSQENFQQQIALNIFKYFFKFFKISYQSSPLILLYKGV